MDKFIYNALNKYFKTLSRTGTISQQDKYSLFVVSTLYSMYKAFGKIITKEGVEKMNKYIRCVTNNKCIFDKNVPCFPYSTSVDNSLITIIANDIITTTTGITMTASNNVTQKFTDFSVRTDIQPDQFLVGYDRSDNNELAINVHDLGVFWEVDI